MKCHEIRLKPKGKPEHIEIVVFCCAHFGHKACDKRRLMDWRRYIMRKPNTFVFNLGDDMENAIPGDEVHNSMMWDSDSHPDQQFMDAADYWQPVAESGKLLMTHDSNHAWRTEAKTGRSVAKDLNVFLQAQRTGRSHYKPVADALPRWGRWQALTRLRVGSQSYTIHSWHGSGGATTPESALRKCRSQEGNHVADLFLMGHFHQPICWGKQYMDFSGNGRDAVSKQRWFGVTGGFIGWHDTYAERAGYAPNRLGPIIVRLGVNRWDVRIST